MGAWREFFCDAMSMESLSEGMAGEVGLQGGCEGPGSVEAAAA